MPTKKKQKKKYVTDKADGRMALPPFNCDESLVYELAGAIIADGASNFRRCGRAKKRVLRAVELGIISQGRADNLLVYYDGEMLKERLFIESPLFLILLGVSRLKPSDVISMIEREIDDYDPTEDVAAIDPSKGKPYSLEYWRNVFRERMSSK